MNEPVDVAVVGSVNADLTVRVDRHPRPGETILGRGGVVSAGGKGANQAVAAALQGARVALVGAVGDDPYAEPATACLRKAGVDLSSLATVEDPTGLAVITVDEHGENTIVVVPGANSHVNDSFVQERASVVRTATVVLLQGEIPADGFTAAVTLATGRVVVNLAPVVPVDNEAILKADPLLANEHEAGLILEMLGSTAGSEEPKDLAMALIALGFKSVVLTLGAKGALVASGQQVIPIPTPIVKPIDTVGAGDAFAGALASRLVAGDSLTAAASYAARVGAFATTRNGAQSSYPGPLDTLPETYYA